MDAAEYKHLVLGLLFVKTISDTFAARRAEVAIRLSDPDDDYQHGQVNAEDLAAELEDRDNDTEVNAFWVPESARWHCGDPPAGNANTAWLQHMLHHLKPTGRAGMVLATGSMSSSQNNEGQSRAAMVDADGVEVMIALPGPLFFNTQIPACSWFLVKHKRRRQGEVLFIDGRKLAVMISRGQCECQPYGRMLFRHWVAVYRQQPSCVPSTRWRARCLRRCRPISAKPKPAPPSATPFSRA